ncbi:hypothetical protein MZM54_02665 [[Brevibacterium] frigoritolerans]|nr:hypothetical protein [Peribacillus frigoritolerans]
MKYSELNEKAKKQAVWSVFEDVQLRINWESENEWIKERIAEILEEYHCYDKEVEYKYEYSRVHFGWIEPEFDVEKLLKRKASLEETSDVKENKTEEVEKDETRQEQESEENQETEDRSDLIELLNEIEEVSDGYSGLQFSFNSSKSEVSCFVDYLSAKEVSEMWEYVQKYAAEFELPIGKIEVQLIFGLELEALKGEIKGLFEEVIRNNGNKIVEVLTPMVEEMRGKLIKATEGTLNYLESDECVKDWLNDVDDVFEFDELGNKIDEEDMEEVA